MKPDEEVARVIVDRISMHHLSDYAVRQELKAQITAALHAHSAALTAKVWDRAIAVARLQSSATRIVEIMEAAKARAAKEKQ